MTRIFQRRPYRLAVLTWLAIWPSITLLLLAGEPFLGAFPLPVRTFVLTAILVPFMSFFAMPRLTRWVDSNLAHDLTAEQSARKVGVLR